MDAIQCVILFVGVRNCASAFCVGALINYFFEEIAVVTFFTFQAAGEHGSIPDVGSSQ